MSDCLDNAAQCSPVPSQAFPAPLPEGIPADVITYAFDGVCPGLSGLDPCGNNPISVAKALDQIEAKLCNLNPRGIGNAPDCSPIVVKNGIATPVSAIEALNCLPKTNPGDVPQFNGVEWVIGPILYSGDTPAPATTTTVAAIPYTGGTTNSAKATVTGQVITADVILNPVANNKLSIGPSGLLVSPISCTDLTPLLDPASATTCYPDKTDNPSRVLSTGGSGIGYRALPPSTGGSGGGVTYTSANTPTVNTSISGTVISAVANISTTPGNKLSANATGLFIPGIGCADLTPLLDPTSATTCYPDKTDNPSRVLSTGPSGIGYRALPPSTSGGGGGVTYTSANTPTVNTSISGTVISAVANISTTPGNKLSANATGLFIPGIGCADLTPLLDPTSATTCYPSKLDAPALVLSTGPSGIGYRTLPPSTSGGGTPYTGGTTNSTKVTVTGQVITADVIKDPAAANKLSIGPSGLLVLPPTCAEVMQQISSVTAATPGCVANAGPCVLPKALLGHEGSVPGYYSGKPLYTAEAYPISVPTQQALSTVGLTLNEITSLMSILPGDENGLCPGEASFWDPALNRFTITRPGRYTYNWALFMRIIMENNGFSANGSLYAGMRFVRPAGVVNGRSVSGKATTLRGTQWNVYAGNDASTQDYTSTGSHTFIATAGTQLSLRAVAIPSPGYTISSFIVRGDSGHFSLSELPDRQF